MLEKEVCMVELEKDRLARGYRKYSLYNSITENAEFKESEHPRGDDGKFGTGGKGKTEKSRETTTKKDSNLTTKQQQQTQSPEFKKWFGDSKVVDKNGEPLVVYHGGNGEVDDFSRGASRGKTGSAYFTDSKEAAEKYAYLGGIDAELDEEGESYKKEYEDKLEMGTDEEKEILSKRDPHITEAFISIQNPIDPEKISFSSVIDSLGKDYVKSIIEDDDAFIEMEEDPDFDKEEYLNENLASYLEGNYSNDNVDLWENTIGEDFNSYYSKEDEWLNASGAYLFVLMTENLDGYMEKAGFDGVIYDDQETGERAIVPKDAKQIKSSNDNEGSFNPESSNIKNSCNKIKVYRARK